MDKWIPTSKRLPEEDFVGQVLISRTWFNRIDKHYYSAVGECHFCWYKGNPMWYLESMNRYVDPHTVKAWKPLPEPYKEDEQ